MSKVGTSIETASSILKNNGLVAIPTETVYGLAGNGLNPISVLKIFSAKKRPSFDPLIIHSSKDKIFNWVSYVPDKAQLLADKFWPGPLTLVLPKADIIPYETTSGLDTVGVRVPRHSLTLELLSQLDFPLAAPSANPFSYISPTTAQHVIDQLGNEVDYVLDGGSCNVGIESTIVGFEKGQPVIYRLGGLSIEEIESVIGKVELQINYSSNPKAPGMAKVHYAPQKPLVLVDDFSEAVDDAHTAYILFNEQLEIDSNRQFFLSKSDNYFEAAAQLYALLRYLDISEFSKIVVKRLPDISLGTAINDRLLRAATKS